MAITKNWNSTYETQPADTDNPKYGDDNIRSTRIGVRERLEKEHVAGISETYTGHGWHRPGSAMAFCQAAAPTTMNDTDSNGGAGLTALGNDTKSIGRLWIDTDTAGAYYWNGTAWVALAGTDPVGTVKFFHGTWVDNVTIPGWYECTAANAAAHAVADLAGKLIMGAALATYTYGTTGGLETATLATTNLAVHSHGAGTHTHPITLSGSSGNVSADHYHYLANAVSSGTALTSGSQAIAGDGTLTSSYTLASASAASITVGRSSGGIADHSHSLSTGSGTATAGSGSTGNTGSALAFSILPPYYVLHAIERAN